MKKIPKNALVLMIGPAGAGKTTLAKNKFPLSEILSSDDLREKLCNNFRDLSRDKDVFLMMDIQTMDRLSKNKRVVIDATNLHKKSRYEYVKYAQYYNNPVYYIVVNRPMEEKKRDGGWRNELPFLMPKHEKIFKANLDEILLGDGLAVVIDYRIEDFDVEI